MAAKDKFAKLEDEIIPSTWEDRDNDIVVQSIIDRKLGLEPKYELD